MAYDFSELVFNLMCLYGFFEAAEAYKNAPYKFARKRQLEKAWTEFHKRKLN